MTSPTLLYPPSLFVTPTFTPPPGPKGGILLNGRNSRFPAGLASSGFQPRSHVYAPSTTSAASTSSDSDALPPSASPRKIRFAPLPDIRRDAIDHPLLGDESASDVPYEPSPRPESVQLPEEATDYLYKTDSRSSEKRAKKGSWSATKKLFKPFLTLPGAKSMDDLFRASSRDSTAGTDGGPIERRMSTGMTTLGASQSQGMVPLIRISSASSDRRQQRMLNGRVYGASRSQAGATKHVEPEFVEWGYGGMGSNKAASTAPRTAHDWGKVQSNQRVAAAPEDEDDGSGMGWVKRRRQQREAEKKAREEQEARDKAEAIKAEERKELPISPPIPQQPVSEAPPPSTATKTPYPPHLQRRDSADSAHVYTATLLPPPSHASHHHHHHHDRSGTPTPSLIARSSSERYHSGTPSRLSSERYLTVKDESPERSATSGSDVSDADESDSDSSEDDEEDKLQRKTSMSAGVEKISRHKE
ncbi:hypothetical protein BOTBODRAFT_171396 [Botryobasidium botryosum FD-172 SS1]|uniref:Uncharacterized protein n=1 Tax=Botryobasidium botryosum (strain FD-172 SS1) TaxID=930990 RepID=A0A067N355_BOTB1|nr:hypothetical protein BOTBODRAFT_171396 [Botryobasidium botryosum FD-172 SS1]